MTVTVTGIGLKPVTYSFKNSTTVAGIAIAGETTAKLNVAVTTTPVTGLATGSEVKGTVKLSATPTATDVVAYRVVCSKLGLDEVVTTTAADWSIRLNSDVEIKDADFVVTAVKALKLDTAASSYNAGVITLVFNKEVDADTVNAANITVTGSATVTSGSFSVSGNVVTIKADAGNFAAGNSVTVGANVKGIDGSFVVSGTADTYTLA